MIEITAPENPILSMVFRESVFLAGSIEQNKAEDWQVRMIDELRDEEFCVVYNPRRKNWNPDLPQTIDNEQFYEQVTWELHRLDISTIVPMYFQPGTMSPITLLELGLYADSGKLIVCCPEGFWRKGNVDIICEKYGIEQVDTLEELTARVKQRVRGE